MVAQENAAVINLKPYSYKELITLYGVSQRTFKTWLNPFMHEIGEKHGRYFNVKQIEVIFRKLGFPKNMQEV